MFRRTLPLLLLPLLAGESRTTLLALADFDAVAASHGDAFLACHSPNPSSSIMITIQPGQTSGRACILGLRMTAWDVLEMLADGMSGDEILSDVSYLEKADFQGAYAQAAQMGRNPKTN